MNPLGDVYLYIRPMLMQLFFPLQVGDIILTYHPEKKHLIGKRITKILPNGTLWIEGDNPNYSVDSRHFGPIDGNSVVARIYCRLWPIVFDYNVMFLKNLDKFDESTMNLENWNVFVKHANDEIDLKNSGK